MYCNNFSICDIFNLHLLIKIVLMNEIYLNHIIIYIWTIGMVLNQIVCVLRFVIDVSEICIKC